MHLSWPHGRWSELKRIGVEWRFTSSPRTSYCAEGVSAAIKSRFVTSAVVTYKLQRSRGSPATIVTYERCPPRRASYDCADVASCRGIIARPTERGRRCQRTCINLNNHPLGILILFLSRPKHAGRTRATSSERASRWVDDNSATYAIYLWPHIIAEMARSKWLKGQSPVATSPHPIGTTKRILPGITLNRVDSEIY